MSAAIRSVLSIALLLCLGRAPALGAAGGAPDRITVTFHGDAASARGFTWYTSTSAPGSDLQVVPASGAAPDFSGAAGFTGRAYAPRNSAAELAHKAEASGLKPATSYYFRVGDSARGVWSAAGYFVTAPLSGPFTFLDAADPQAKTKEECALSAATIAKAFTAVPGAAFLALNGDTVDKGDEEDQWRTLLGLAAPELTHTTLLPVAGNHEAQKGAFIDHFDVKPAPGSAVKSGAYYSTDYSNAHFIVLNTNESSWPYADLSRAQVRWLKDDAAAARARGADWLIVLLHKGPYTTSWHSTDSDIAGRRGVRTKIAPLLAGLGVDLVLQGHDHIYARTKPLAASGKAVPAVTEAGTFGGEKLDYYVSPGAPVYLIPATAGAKVYDRNKNEGPEYYDLFERAEEQHAAAHGRDPKRPENPVRGYVQDFTAVTIDGRRLTAVSYEIDKTRDGGRPFVMDRFGILKSGAPATGR